MKLNEIKNKSQHYFLDEYGRKQGQYRDWHRNGQQWVICHYRDGRLQGEFNSWIEGGRRRTSCYYQYNKLHGEYKYWNSLGELFKHRFCINDKEIIDFIKNPELYPTTSEDRLLFALRYENGRLLDDINIKSS